MKKTAMIMGVVLIAAVCFSSEPAAEKDQKSTEEANMQNAHQHFSAACFNACWALIDKKERSDEDVENMILAANASVWHWKQRTDCQPMNLSVGYWQLSRVYALADNHVMAELYGEKCLKISRDSKLSAFYVGYAYEALTRAAWIHQDIKKAREYLAEAENQLEKVNDQEEKALFQVDLSELNKKMK